MILRRVLAIKNWLRDIGSQILETRVIRLKDTEKLKGLFLLMSAIKLSLYKIK